jgi:hypothetical protein
MKLRRLNPVLKISLEFRENDMITVGIYIKMYVITNGVPMILRKR